MAERERLDVVVVEAILLLLLLLLLSTRYVPLRSRALQRARVIRLLCRRCFQEREGDVDSLGHYEIIEVAAGTDDAYFISGRA